MFEKKMIAMMLTLSMLAAAFAGCLGGDDEPEEEWALTPAADVSAVYVTSDWDPIIPNLNDGTMCEAILSTMTITEAREEVVDFTRGYYTSSQGVIGSSSAAAITSVSDLNAAGTKVAVQSGTTSQIFAEGDGTANSANLPLATIQAYADFPSVTAAVANGDADYALGDAPVLALAGTILAVFSDENYGIAVAEDDNGELLDALNVAITAVIDSGEHDLIAGAWDLAAPIVDDSTADTATAYPTPTADSTLTTVLERGTLKFCSDTSYPPFENLDASGNAVGFSIDLGNAIVDEIAAHYMGTANPTFAPNLGCTDSAASNYDDTASSDDGSCAFSFRIGFLNPITGPLAVYSSKFTGAANMAISDLNALDSTYSFSLSEADSACGTGTDAAAQSLADAGVVGVAGAACSGASMAANGVLGPLGIPMVSYASTNPGLSDDTAYPHFFRVVPSDAWQGPALAAAVTAAGVSNPAMLYMTNDYGSGLAGAFEDTWGTNNLCTKAGYDPATKTDYSAEIAAIASAGCDSVVMITYATDGAAIIETMAGAGLSLPTFGADGVASGDFMSEFNVSAGSSPALTNGLVATKPRSGATDFVARCAAEPTCAGGIYTAEAYDAVMILGRAAMMGNGADMDTHIAHVGTDYAAASALTLTFDSHGDVAPTNGYSVCQFDALSSTDVYFNCMKYWDQSAGITAETFTGLTVKIGLLAGTTGPLAVYGPGFITAANIALGVMNIAGFGNGVQFELVIADPACGVGDAGTTGAQALADAGVWGVVGAACSGATAQALAVLDPLGIPMISYASTNPALSNATNFFRTVPSDASQGPAIAAAVAADGYSNPALLHMTNDYGAGLAGATSAAWEALDSNSDGTNNALCTTIGYAESTTDFTSQITAIDSAGCDSIILVSYATDGAAIIEEMAAQSLSIGVFGGDGIAKTGIGTGMADNSTLEGIVATLPAAGPANERSAAFAVLCGSVSACDAGIYTAETFDAMLIMGYSIFASLSSPGVPKAAMIAAVGVGFVGASGVHTFGYDGNAPDIDPINGYCVGTFHVDTTGTTNVVTFDCERSFTEADGVATETSS